MYKYNNQSNFEKGRQSWRTNTAWFHDIKLQWLRECGVDIMIHKENRIKKYTHKCRKLIFNTNTNSIQWRKNILFSTNGIGTTSNAKINSKLIIDLNVKPKSIEL